VSTSINIGETKLTLVLGDITKQETDAIVNAANSSLLGGGGVDGAIHRAGGRQILEECIKIREKQGGCDTGEAVITTGGNLPAKYVIHTVGPIWQGGSRGELRTLLANCYKNSLKLAVENGIKTISFPSISTGAYGYPVDEASPIALKAVIEFLQSDDSLDEVVFVLYEKWIYQSYEDALRSLKQNRRNDHQKNLWR
jgi:O-acetyl-ADP-ribose deacetylase (regulator of RNase III)